MKRITLGLVFATSMMFLAAGSVAFAQTSLETTSAVSHAEVQPVGFMEKVKLFFTFNPEKKTNILQDFSNRNFELAKQKIEEGKTDEATAFFQKSDDNISKATVSISKIQDEEKQKEKLNNISNNASSRTDALVAVQAKVESPVAQKAITQAIQRQTVVKSDIDLKIQSLLNKIAELEAKIKSLQGGDFPVMEDEEEDQLGTELPILENETEENLNGTELPILEDENGEGSEETEISCDDNSPHMSLDWYQNVALNLTVQPGQDDVEFARLKIVSTDCDIEIDAIIVNSHIPNSNNSNKLENIRAVIDGQTIMSSSSLPTVGDPNIVILAGTAKVISIYADVKPNATPGVVRLGISDMKRTLIDSNMQSYPISSTPSIGFVPNGVYGNTVTISN